MNEKECSSSSSPSPSTRTVNLSSGEVISHSGNDIALRRNVPPGLQDLFKDVGEKLGDQY